MHFRKYLNTIKEYTIMKEDFDDFDDFNEDDFNNHPLDDFFNAKQIVINEEDICENVKSELYDEKDDSIDNELTNLAILAQKTFQEQKKIAMRVEPKFRADLLNAANTLLALSLQAISKKADMKSKKDAIIARSKRQTLQIGNSENTNIILADRNELLKARKQKKES